MTRKHSHQPRFDSRFNDLVPTYSRKRASRRHRAPIEDYKQLWGQDNKYSIARLIINGGRMIRKFEHTMLWSKRDYYILKLIVTQRLVTTGQIERLLGQKNMRSRMNFLFHNHIINRHTPPSDSLSYVGLDDLYCWTLGEVGHAIIYERMEMSEDESPPRYDPFYSDSSTQLIHDLISTELYVRLFEEVRDSGLFPQWGSEITATIRSSITGKEIVRPDGVFVFMRQENMQAIPEYQQFVVEERPETTAVSSQIFLEVWRSKPVNWIDKHNKYRRAKKSWLATRQTMNVPFPDVAVVIDAKNSLSARAILKQIKELYVQQQGLPANEQVHYWVKGWGSILREETNLLENWYSTRSGNYKGLLDITPNLHTSHQKKSYNPSGYVYPS